MPELLVFFILPPKKWNKVIKMLYVPQNDTNDNYKKQALTRCCQQKNKNVMNH